LRAFLDFEASSLAKLSYPVEVAWVFEDGRSETHLLRPLPGWTDWDEGAAAIHGISRDQLLAAGEDVAAVTRHLLEVMNGHVVYASSPSWDGKWLSVLLRGGGLPRHALRLRDTDEAQLEIAREMLAPNVPAGAIDAIAAEIIARVRAAASTAPIVHRALADAEHERQIWLAVRDAAAAFRPR
jgi:hypothetical protein